MNKQELKIDKVMVDNLDVALRSFGINLSENDLDVIIDVIELIKEKGDDVTLRDLITLKESIKLH